MWENGRKTFKLGSYTVSRAWARAKNLTPQPYQINFLYCCHVQYVNTSFYTMHTQLCMFQVISFGPVYLVCHHLVVCCVLKGACRPSSQHRVLVPPPVAVARDQCCVGFQSAAARPDVKDILYSQGSESMFTATTP